MRILSIVGLALLSSAAFSNSINEFLVNPPGTDQGGEFIELKGIPSTSVAGLTFVVIEGDGTTVYGIVDQAVALTGSYGTNGLFMIRDAATALSPAPHPATTIQVHDFTPDIENGANTYLLVSGWSGIVGMDLDTNNDGILDAMPWTTVHASIGYLATGATPGFAYAAQIGGTNFVQAGFTPDAVLKYGSGLIGLDVSGTVPGPFTLFSTNCVDPTGAIVTLPVTFTLTPGSENPSPSATFNPASFTVIDGTHFGGNLASLAASDNDPLFILNDESDSTATVEFVATGVTTPTTSVTLNLETAASRDDLTEFYRTYNYTTSAFVTVDSATSSLTDAIHTIGLPGAATDWVSGGEAKARIQWIPQTDLEAADGWIEIVDHVEWAVL
jgi:hypothetical protein